MIAREKTGKSVLQPQQMDSANSLQELRGDSSHSWASDETTALTDTWLAG